MSRTLINPKLIHEFVNDSHFDSMFEMVYPNIENVVKQLTNDISAEIILDQIKIALAIAYTKGKDNYDD